MIQTYVNLFGMGKDIWKNTIVVITKVGWNSDFDDIGEWIEE